MKIGDKDSILVTEVDGATVVLEILRLSPSVEVAEDVVGSIHFLGSLPTSPGS